MKNTSKLFWFGILLATVVSSCKKFVDIQPPKNQIVTSQVFADSTDANAALLGIYISMMNDPLGISSGGTTLFPGLSADEIYPSANNIVYNQFYTDNVQSNNNTNAGFWTAAYNYIYIANSCIEGAGSSGGLSASVKNEIIAEARFIRAFEYFYLVNLYGGVPLITGTGFSTNAVVGRATVNQVYAQVISDLLYAETTLGANTGTNQRPTSLAASALLAKVYLYEGKNELAVSEASKVINSGQFALEEDLNNVFLNTSTETIWQIVPVVPDRATWEGAYFVPSSSTATPKYILTNSLYKAFEPGDQRLTSWVKVNSVGTNSYPFPYKYKESLVSGTPAEYEVVLRLADMFLVRAEANANENNVNAAAADLNIIRNRAGLPNTTATGEASMLTAIQNERRIEFFCEWGNRWFDLKRWNIAAQVLGPVKSSWNVNDQLYPIPINEINTNPGLVQNPGY